MGLDKSTVKYLSQHLNNIPIFENLNPSEIFGRIDFFKGVNDDILNEVADSVQISEFEEDTIICRHGKFDERFYIILSGWVKAVIPTLENPRLNLYRLGTGDFFGEEIVVSPEPRENSIIAGDSVMTLSMDAETLKKLIAASDNIRAQMDKSYIERDLRGDLRRVPLFTNLGEDIFNEVLGNCELLSFPKGNVVFREGDDGDCFYLIRDGRVDVHRSVNGDKKLVAILGEDQYFGEMSLLADDTRNATVECRTECELVKLTKENFHRIIGKDTGMMEELRQVYDQRTKNREDVLHNPNAARIDRMLLDLNSDINRHLDILSQCVIDTESGGALLATLPGSRYPYVYPRDSACASRFLYKVITSPMKSGEIAFRLLGEIARFILHCQSDEGYWGQRYGINGEDKGIYKQEDNVAHGVVILCRYLLAAKHKNVEVPIFEDIISSICRGFKFAKKHYYRNEIHLFYSTTSIHESAIEEGYSIWVNFSFLLMLRLMEEVGKEYGMSGKFEEAMELRNGFEPTIDKIFTISNRYVRRIKPNGEIDLRPDITLMSPFFFGTGMEKIYFSDNDDFQSSIKYIEQTLWDPDLAMLQRYLPFIEDPHTHIHAGNGPWLQYTAMLAQYNFFRGDIERGNEIMGILDSYKSKEGYLCEHLTTPERFREFKQLEWLSGSDFDKEFAPNILVDGITYDLIVEELNHMKNSYDDVEQKSTDLRDNAPITFAIPLMWSHAEYAMALMFRTEKELEILRKSADESITHENQPSVRGKK